MYKVIRYFRDTQDNRHAYNVGDTFPHDGRAISQERINALVNGNNFQQVPLIKYVPDDSGVKSKAKSKVSKDETKDMPKEEAQYEKSEIEKMPYFKLKSVAKEYGVDVKDKKVDEIRAELMEKL